MSWSIEQRPGGWAIATRSLKDGTIERKRVIAVKSKGKIQGVIDGKIVETQSAERTSDQGAQIAADELVAQFPGKVRKVLVKNGAKVAAGDPLVLIEAMKMEFAVKAPAAGTVVKVLIQDGQQLLPGDPFFEFEETTRGA
jgi:propionyl-CoA carboxylase alpha chain